MALGKENKNGEFFNKMAILLNSQNWFKIKEGNLTISNGESFRRKREKAIEISWERGGWFAYCGGSFGDIVKENI